MRTPVRAFGWSVLVLGSAIACGGGGGDGGGGGGGGPDLSIAKAGAPNGDAQSGVVGQFLTDSLAVLVQEDGSPKAGVTITWSAQATNAAVSPTTSQTDVNGRAATRLTLGSAAGAQTARATLSGATGSPVTFNATATAGPPTSFVPTAGTSQTASVSTNFATPLAARLADAFGNGIPGVTVTWEVLSGPVTLSGGNTSVTNANGAATKVIIAGGTTGDAVVRATNAAIAGNADFSDLTVVLAPVEVAFGSNFFRSGRNNSENPAVDTVAVGRAVRWTGTGGTHTVRSQGPTSFTSSGNLVGSGASYTVTFNAAGTYEYDCAIHGPDMTGRIVVVP